MGLDIYVGTFHRYYAGQWDTVIQEMAHGSGLEVQVLRPQPGLLNRLRSWFRPKRDPVKEIERWKGRLSAAAGVPLDWNEHPEAEYFTDKPGWESYGALLLWAACEERGADRPETAEGWEQNALLIEAMRDPSSKYRHLLGNTEIWLPVDFAELFEAEAPDGSPKVFGSVQRLASELASLNGSTWRAEEPEISEWRQEAPDWGSPLDESARFGRALRARGPGPPAPAAHEAGLLRRPGLVWSKAQSRIPSVIQEETTADSEAPKALGTRRLSGAGMEMIASTSHG